MPLQDTVLAILAVWRITHLLAAEDGPAWVLTRLRRRLGPGFWGQLAGCFYCLSLWTAAPVALLAAGGWGERLEIWLACSGGAILLERATSPRAAAALYLEDADREPANLREEDADVLRPAVVDAHHPAA